jgi:hypothetical protein
VVLWVIGSIGGCAVLATEADDTVVLIEQLTTPALQVLLDPMAPFGHGPHPF